MSGALHVCSMRYGVLDIDHMEALLGLRVCNILSYHDTMLVSYLTNQWWIVYELLFDRHPDPKARSSSEALARMLLKSDRALLHWSDEDKVVASEATILGKPLSFGENFMKTCRNFMLFINVSEMLHSIIAVFVAPTSFSVYRPWYGLLAWRFDLYPV